MNAEKAFDPFEGAQLVDVQPTIKFKGTINALTQNPFTYIQPGQVLLSLPPDDTIVGVSYKKAKKLGFDIKPEFVQASNYIQTHIDEYLNRTPEDYDE